MRPTYPWPIALSDCRHPPMFDSSFVGLFTKCFDLHEISKFDVMVQKALICSPGIYKWIPQRMYADSYRAFIHWVVRSQISKSRKVSRLYINLLALLWYLTGVLTVCEIYHDNRQKCDCNGTQTANFPYDIIFDKVRKGHNQMTLPNLVENYVMGEISRLCSIKTRYH